MSAAAGAQRPRAPPFVDPPGYARHRPESTLLYRLVEQHYPAFRELRAESGRPLPAYVQQEFESYLKCGRLEEGFLRVRCAQCHAETLVAFSCKKRGFCPSCGARRMAETAALLADEVLPDQPLRQWVLSLPHALRFLLARDPAVLTLVLGVVYRTIARHVIERAGLTCASGATGAITVVQRFGSALNLNVHFHMLFLDGAYRAAGGEPPVFQPAPAPGAQDLQGLVERIAARVGDVLERRGLIQRDLEHAWLALDGEAGLLDDVLGHSITYRIAVGPRAGQKLFTLQTVPPRPDGLDRDANGAARAGGFSLHAGVDVAPRDRSKLERLCRYISRPPVATERLSLTPTGQVRYALKTPYRDGTTHLVLEPLDLMARLAAAGGFSLHAGVDVAPRDRSKLERLCRYISRPPVATERLSLTPTGQVRYALKTPYRDGTTHLVLEPLDLMARLAALVPPPRMHLTRYHGVFAPHSWLRAAVTPAGRGVRAEASPTAERVSPPAPRHVAMSWARRLKRVFGVEIERCARCKGRLAIIVSIEEPAVIARILAHLERTWPARYSAAPSGGLPVGARAPPREPARG